MRKISLFVFIWIFSIFLVYGQSTSSLANTKWQYDSGGYGIYDIIFGRTSFITNMFAGGVQAGTYRLSGENIIFVINGREWQGALIGSTLTAFQGTFRRIGNIDNPVRSGNPLANTRWQYDSGGYGIYDITFGQTNFTTDMFAGGVRAGTYRISSDAVIFVINGQEWQGALIGNTLTAFQGTFRRIE